jgi:hypothetical protein
MEGCAAAGCLSGGTTVNLSEMVSGGRGCEMDRVGGGAFCDSEGVVAKGRSLEGRFSGVLGGSGGPGDVCRSICTEFIGGVDRGRGTAGAARRLAMRCWEAKPDFRSMNRLNSYFERINFSSSESRSESTIFAGGGWRASSGLYNALDLIFPFPFITSTCSLLHSSRVMLLTLVMCVPILRWMLAQFTQRKMPRL